MLKKLAIFLMVPVFSLLIATSQLAYAETYGGFSLGVSLPHDVNDIKATLGADSATATDLSPENAFAYGFKVGHYFKNIPWLGVEFNFYQRDPDVAQQTATAVGTLGIFSAAATGQLKVDVNSATTFGLLVMMRATEEQTKNLYNFEPFLGIGLGLNLVDLGEASTFNAAGVLQTSTNLGSDTSVGILISAGLNYKLTDKIKAYGEYKYTDSSYELNGSDGVTYEFDSGDSSLMFGIAYGF